jgi:hypothetical protein
MPLFGKTFANRETPQPALAGFYNGPALARYTFYFQEPRA